MLISVLSSLDRIFDAQGPLSEWPTNGGYLLYITSTENDEYWRPYVGQSVLLTRRITQHITEILHGSINTLCYWVASKPGRQVNFIRLWETIEEENDSQQTVDSLNSFLEMLFCLCFQSLPLPTLKKFLHDQEFSLRGRNVVSPLLQSIILTKTERTVFRSWLRYSTSLETREFEMSRSDQLEKERKPSFRRFGGSPSYKDIKEAFEKVIPQGLFTLFGDKVVGAPVQSPQVTDLNTLQGKVVSYLNQRRTAENLWGLPYGSMEARIGFVLDVDILSTNPDRESDLPALFPAALSSLGFHRDNCLLWSYNFEFTYVPRRFSLASFEDRDLREINRQIIDASSLQVIIICGPNAERMAIPPSTSFHKTKLEIEKASFEVFLEIEQSTVRRVYLRLPTFLSALHSGDWRTGAKVSLAIKVAACLTKTQDIRPYHFRSQVALSEVVVARLREEEGKSKMTIDTISENVLSWLYVQGFDSSYIPRLAEIGGSVSRGILLAMVTAPYQPEEHKTQTRQTRPFPKSDRPCFCHHFTKWQLQKLREIHSQMSQERSLKQKDVSHKSSGLVKDLSEATEVSQGQQTISFDELAFQSSIDPVTNRETFETMTDCLEVETPELSFKPSKSSHKRRKQQILRRLKHVPPRPRIQLSKISDTHSKSAQPKLRAALSPKAKSEKGREISRKDSVIAEVEQKLQGLLRNLGEKVQDITQDSATKSDANQNPVSDLDFV